MTDSYAGVDYSLKALDIAVVRGPTLVSATQYALGVDLASRIAVIQRALDELIATPDAPSVICMEQPWVREGRGIKTALDLHRIPHYVEFAAGINGITHIQYVAVPTWHRDVLGNGGLSSEDAKAWSLRYVKMVYGHDAASDNSADAICLASWARDAAKLRERMPV